MVVVLGGGVALLHWHRYPIKPGQKGGGGGGGVQSPLHQPTLLSTDSCLNPKHMQLGLKQPLFLTLF